MSRDRSSEPPIEFTLPGDCQCDGSPHPEGDKVWFRPHLGALGGLAATAAINAAARRGISTMQEDIERELGLIYVIHGVVEWNFLSDQGKEIPVSEEVIRHGLDWAETTYHLVDKAGELYGEEAFAPLVKRLPSSTKRGQTVVSISRKRPSSGTRQKPSRPSSPAGSAASRQSAG